MDELNDLLKACEDARQVLSVAQGEVVRYLTSNNWKRYEGAQCSRRRGGGSGLRRWVMWVHPNYIEAFERGGIYPRPEHIPKGYYTHSSDF